MPKEWLKLQSVGGAVTRVIDLNGDFLRRQYPNATKTTPLYGRWVYDESKKEFRLKVIESKTDPNTKS